MNLVKESLRPTRSGSILVRGFYLKNNRGLSNDTGIRVYEWWEVFDHPASRSLFARKPGGDAGILLFDPRSWGTEEIQPDFWTFLQGHRASRHFTGSAGRRILDAFALKSEGEWRRENGAFAP